MEVYVSQATLNLTGRGLKIKIGEASSKLERESLKVERQVQKWRGKFKIVEGEFKSGEASSKFERQVQNLRGKFKI